MCFTPLGEWRAKNIQSRLIFDTLAKGALKYTENHGLGVNAIKNHVVCLHNTRGY
jgi:hypothetical protein